MFKEIFRCNKKSFKHISHRYLDVLIPTCPSLENLKGGLCLITLVASLRSPVSPSSSMLPSWWSRISLLQRIQAKQDSSRDYVLLSFLNNVTVNFTSNFTFEYSQPNAVPKHLSRGVLSNTKRKYKIQI